MFSRHVVTSLVLLLAISPALSFKQVRGYRLARVVSSLGNAANRGPVDQAYDSEQLSRFNQALTQLRTSIVNTPSSPPADSSIPATFQSVIPSSFKPPRPTEHVAGSVKLKEAPVFYFGDGIPGGTPRAEGPPNRYCDNSLITSGFVDTATLLRFGVLIVTRVTSGSPEAEPQT
jgi:hypothetical protein